MADREKIKLHAIYRKDGTITICDQDGREFDAESETLGHRSRAVLVELALEAPHWLFEEPRAHITISIPLDVEERLPEWMKEHLSDRIG